MPSEFRRYTLRYLRSVPVSKMFSLDSRLTLLYLAPDAGSGTLQTL